MAHFYLNEALQDTVTGATIALEGSEAKHAGTVSRVRPGETLLVGNGRGLLVDATVSGVEPGRVTLTVNGLRMLARQSPRLTLVQALAKGGRDELAIQVATELGVDRIVPWAAGRSISRWEGAKIAKGQERWAAIVREASKQAILPWLPELSPLAGLSDLVALCAGARVIVLEPDALHPLSAIDVAGAEEVVLVVGPEGGVSEHERERLAAAGAAEARLGETVLRTSSAGPAALAVLNVTLGRW